MWEPGPRACEARSWFDSLDHAWNSGLQVWRQEPLSADLSQQPLLAHTQVIRKDTAQQPQKFYFTDPETPFPPHLYLAASGVPRFSTLSHLESKWTPSLLLDLSVFSTDFFKSK